MYMYVYTNEGLSQRYTAKGNIGN